MILLIVNAFLLVLVLDREHKSERYDHRAREETVSILARSGISIRAELIPKDMALTAMTVPVDRSSERTQAAALLGEDAALSSGGAYVGSDGSSLRFYSDGAFSFLAASGAYPLRGATPAKAAQEYLKKLQFSGKVLALTEEQGEDGGAGSITVTLQLYWNDLPVFAPSETTVTFRGDELHSIEGYRLTGVPVPEEGGATLSVSTILLQLLDHITRNSIVCREITQVTEGYTLSVTQGSQPRLIPTWHIVTDTNPGGYSLNAITGEIL